MTEAKAVKHVDINDLTVVEAIMIGVVSYLALVSGVAFSVLIMRA